MKKRAGLLTASLIVAALMLAWISAAIGARRYLYEVRPEISIPAYQSDAARAIEAYERLMDRHMDMTEMSLLTVAADVKALTRTLEGMNQRLARIEEALGIKPPAKKAELGPESADAPSPQVGPATR